MNKNPLEELAGKLADAVPGSLADSLNAGLGDARAELRSNFHAVLQGALDKMDLVTREEFEIQRKVLARTREKLEALEKRIDELQSNRA